MTNLPPGRAPGSANKNTEAGRAFAGAVIEQRDGDIVKRTVLCADRAQLAELIESLPLNTEVHVQDLLVTLVEDLMAGDNPVVRKLRTQMRGGVGSEGYQMPATVFNALADRRWGKVVDRVKMATASARPYEGETDAELAARADALSRALRAAKQEDVPVGDKER
jgi:hypothetical protein